MDQDLESTSLKCAAHGNRAGVRGPAFVLLGELGRGNDRALKILTAALKEQSRQILFSAVQALGTLADPRSIPALEEFAKRPDVPPFARQMVIMVINRIKNAAKENQEKKKQARNAIIIPGKSTAPYWRVIARYIRPGSGISPSAQPHWHRA